MNKAKTLKKKATITIKIDAEYFDVLPNEMKRLEKQFNETISYWSVNHNRPCRLPPVLDNGDGDEFRSSSTVSIKAVSNKKVLLNKDWKNFDEE